MTGARVRSVPHRISFDDVAPAVGRVSVKDAMADLWARGLGEVSGRDLELCRLVMSPAESKRLCARLDRALLDHFDQAVHNAQPAPKALPFGEDLQGAADRERRRQWADRPNGEPLPRSWSVEPECRLDGRLKLVKGREFTATGVRGRLRFRYAIRTKAGEFWIEAFDRDGRYRSIRPERVRRVHAKSKLPPPRRGRGR